MKKHTIRVIENSLSIDLKYKEKNIFSKFKSSISQNNTNLYTKTFYKNSFVLFSIFFNLIIIITGLILLFKEYFNLSSYIIFTFSKNVNIILPKYYIFAVFLLLIFFSVISVLFSFKTYYSIKYISLFILTLSVFLNIMFLLTFYKFLQITI